MARSVPASPAQAEAALDAALACAPRPALPPGLAARIVAQATAQPQFGPLADVAENVAAEPVVPSAQVLPFAPVASPAIVVPPRNRRFVFGGAFAALAASLVAAVVIDQKPAIAPESPKSAEIAVGSEVHLDAPKAHQAAPAPHLAAATPTQNAAPRTRPAAVAITPEPPQVDPVPVQILPPQAPQLATSGERPARDVAGPTTDPSPAPRVVPKGGLMGPPAPQQGWAFTGGAAGGGTMPGGQPMPSQTTGTMPPPSGPGGHGGGHP